MPYDSREVSNLVPVNRKSLEGSVANFSNSYNSGENSVGETGNYRRGLIHKLKMLGAGMMSLIAVACAELNEMDLLSMGLHHRANDPKANLSQSQRNSAWSLGDLFGIVGERRYYKDSSKERENDPWKGTSVVNMIKYDDGIIVFTIDANKVGRLIDCNDTDPFVNTSKYSKSCFDGGEARLIIMYIPF